ncbi:restriction endonuclease [Cellulomonas sp. NPDC058312]|uniref:nSTAND3 domain-containing NTPase n=1 Tax=Cellulomonas sp. NPDC058312 TaxID=3346441 RepID=UPI0036F04A14
MTDGGLAALSPHDFEVLCQDLLNAAWGLSLEGFTKGRDGGVDLRLLKPETGQIDLVVQCKHYLATGYSGLKSRVKNEADTAATVGASRYVLATTVSMTPKRKAELAAILADAGANCAPSDILGKEDILALIRAHPEVEKAHFKLWLNSAAVLERLLHNELYVRSQGYVEELRSNAAVFVHNKSVARAREILDSSHTVLISGPPGVGKTTLSEILLLQAMADGFQAVVISSDIDEADRLYTAGTKQIFVYDDFLGRTTGFEKLGKNEDDRLLRFIKRIESSPTKLLLLTTREYILQQARVAFDRLNSPKMELSKYVLDVGVYTRRNRGHILYNHVFFSGVGPAARESLRHERKYARLIDHANYNPRLIGDAISLFQSSGRAESEFGDYLEEAFDKPTELWRHVFRHQISRMAKRMLAMLTLMEPPSQIASLERSHASFSIALRDDEAFEETMRQLEGSSVDLHIAPWGTMVDFSNPGVQDSVLSILLPDPVILQSVVAASHDFNQLLRLWTYASEPERGVPAHLFAGPRSLTRTASFMLQNAGRNKQVLRPTLRASVVGIGDLIVERLLSLTGTGMHGQSSRTERLGFVVAVTHDLNARTATPDISSALLADSISWEQWDNKGDVLVLLERVVSFPSFDPSVRETLFSRAEDWFSKSLDRPRDFEFLVQLHRLSPLRTQGSDPADLTSEFTDSVAGALETWTDLGDAEELRGFVDELEEAARAVGIELDDLDVDWAYQRDQIDDRIAELERDDYEPDDDRREERGYRPQLGDDDRWLDGLFDTISE